MALIAEAATKYTNDVHRLLTIQIWRLYHTTNLLSPVSSCRLFSSFRKSSLSNSLLMMKPIRLLVKCFIYVYFFIYYLLYIIADYHITAFLIKSHFRSSKRISYLTGVQHSDQHTSSKASSVPVTHTYTYVYGRN